MGPRAEPWRAELAGCEHGFAPANPDKDVVSSNGVPGRSAGLPCPAMAAGHSGAVRRPGVSGVHGAARGGSPRISRRLVAALKPAMAAGHTPLPMDPVDIRTRSVGASLVGAHPHAQGDGADPARDVAPSNGRLDTGSRRGASAPRYNVGHWAGHRHRTDVSVARPDPGPPIALFAPGARSRLPAALTLPRARRCRATPGHSPAFAASRRPAPGGPTAPALPIAAPGRRGRSH